MADIEMGHIYVKNTFTSSWSLAGSLKQFIFSGSGFFQSCFPPSVDPSSLWLRSLESDHFPASVSLPFDLLSTLQSGLDVTHV